MQGAQEKDLRFGAMGVGRSCLSANPYWLVHATNHFIAQFIEHLVCQALC